MREKKEGPARPDQEMIEKLDRLDKALRKTADVINRSDASDQQKERWRAEINRISDRATQARNGTWFDAKTVNTPEMKATMEKYVQKIERFAKGPSLASENKAESLSARALNVMVDMIEEQSDKKEVKKLRDAVSDYTATEDTLRELMKQLKTSATEQEMRDMLLHYRQPVRSSLQYASVHPDAIADTAILITTSASTMRSQLLPRVICAHEGLYMDHDGKGASDTIMIDGNISPFVQKAIGDSMPRLHISFDTTKLPITIQYLTLHARKDNAPLTISPEIENSLKLFDDKQVIGTLQIIKDTIRVALKKPHLQDPLYLACKNQDLLDARPNAGGAQIYLSRELDPLLKKIIGTRNPILLFTFGPSPDYRIRSVQLGKSVYDEESDTSSFIAHNTSAALQKALNELFLDKTNEEVGSLVKHREAIKKRILSVYDSLEKEYPDPLRDLCKQAGSELLALKKDAPTDVKYRSVGDLEEKDRIGDIDVAFGEAPEYHIKNITCDLKSGDSTLIQSLNEFARNTFVSKQAKDVLVGIKAQILAERKRLIEIQEKTKK